MAQRSRRGHGRDNDRGQAPRRGAPHEDGGGVALAVDPHLLHWYRAPAAGGGVAPRHDSVTGGGDGGAAAAAVPLPPPPAYGQGGSPGVAAATPPSFLAMQRPQAACLSHTPHAGDPSTALSTHLVTGVAAWPTSVVLIHRSSPAASCSYVGAAPPEPPPACACGCLETATALSLQTAAGACIGVAGLVLSTWPSAWWPMPLPPPPPTPPMTIPLPRTPPFPDFSLPPWSSSAAAATWASARAQVVPLPPPRSGARSPPALLWSPGWPYGVPSAAEP